MADRRSIVDVEEEQYGFDPNAKRNQEYYDAVWGGSRPFYLDPQAFYEITKTFNDRQAKSGGVGRTSGGGGGGGRAGTVAGGSSSGKGSGSGSGGTGPSTANARPSQRHFDRALQRMGGVAGALRIDRGVVWSIDAQTGRWRPLGSEEQLKYLARQEAIEEIQLQRSDTSWKRTVEVEWPRSDISWAQGQESWRRQQEYWAEQDAIRRWASDRAIAEALARAGVSPEVAYNNPVIRSSVEQVAAQIRAGNYNFGPGEGAGTPAGSSAASVPSQSQTWRPETFTAQTGYQGVWQDPQSGFFWFEDTNQYLGGGFRDYWAQNRDALGKPMTGEYSQGGKVYQNFEHGVLIWDPQTGQITLQK